MPTEEKSLHVKVLQTLIENGLEFGEVVEVYSRYEDNDTKRYRELAKERFHVEGELEIDDDAFASYDRTDGEVDGAYVMAWVWTPKEEKKDAEEGEDKKG